MDMNGKRFASKPAGSSTADDVTIPHIPIIKKSEIAKVLPKYASVLEDTVTMDDLDPLQRDLEKLLSICSIRNQALRSEEEKRDKKGKQYDKTSLKRKCPDDGAKNKKLESGGRLIKKKSSLPVNNLLTDQLGHEVPKVSLPKNDTSDQFWSSVETYCADLTKDDVAFLDNIRQECTKAIDVKIPELGVHYTQDWTEEILNEEQPLGGSPESTADASNELKRNKLNTFSSPITQHLLTLLIEQKVTPVDKLKYNLTSDVFKSSGSSSKAGICVDRRLQKELVEQGILSADDLSKTVPDDEILTEIRKCQAELAAVNEYNLEELNKLRAVVAKDLHRPKLREDLSKVDSQVLDIYNKLICSKRKHVRSEGGKILFTTQPAKDVESRANIVIKQQLMLNREIMELSDVPVLNN